MPVSLVGFSIDPRRTPAFQTHDQLHRPSGRSDRNRRQFRCDRSGVRPMQSARSSLYFAHAATREDSQISPRQAPVAGRRLGRASQIRPRRRGKAELKQNVDFSSEALARANSKIIGARGYGCIPKRMCRCFSPMNKTSGCSFASLMARSSTACRRMVSSRYWTIGSLRRSIENTRRGA